MTPAPLPPVVRSATAGCELAVVGPLVVSVWLERATAPELLHHANLTVQAAKRAGRRAVMIVAVRARGLGVPKTDVLEAVKQASALTMEVTERCIFVMEGQGIRRTLVRIFMEGISAVFGRSEFLRFGDGLEPALRSAAASLDLDPEALLQAMRVHGVFEAWTRPLSEAGAA